MGWDGMGWVGLVGWRTVSRQALDELHHRLLQLGIAAVRAESMHAHGQCIRIHDCLLVLCRYA